MKESEAKTKVCPQMFIALKLAVIGCAATPDIKQSEFGDALNELLPMNSQNCIGSDCMMWQEGGRINNDSESVGRCGLVSVRTKNMLGLR